MKQDRINYLVVGCFVLGMLGILMAVLYRITGIGMNMDHYQVQYRTITGISKGSVVSYGGYVLGQVSDVTPVRVDGRTQYRLTLAIRHGWKIPQDSVARIITPGLLTDNLVDIREGESTHYLQPGDVLQGEEEVGIVAMLNTMAYEIQDVVDKGIKPLIANIDSHASTIGADLGRQIPEMTASINLLLGRLNEGAERINAVLSKESEQHIGRIINNTDRVTENMLTLTEGFGEARRQLSDLLQASSDVVASNRQDIRTSVESLRNTLDAVAGNINAILYNLETTSRNMNEFSRQVRENPGLLLTGAPQKDQAK